MTIKAYSKIILMPALLAIMLALVADATALESGSSQLLRAEAHVSVALVAKIAAQVENLEKELIQQKKESIQQKKIIEQLQSQAKQQEKNSLPQERELACKDSNGSQLTFRQSCTFKEALDKRASEAGTAKKKCVGACNQAQPMMSMAMSMAGGKTQPAYVRYQTCLNKCDAAHGWE